MFAQRKKTWYDKVYGIEKNKRPRRNLDYITCNGCGKKGYYAGNSDFSTQTNLKEDAEAFKNIKQEKYSNKPRGGVYQKALVHQRRFV